MVKALDSKSRNPVFKSTGFDSPFHPSEVDKMSTSSFWKISGKNKLPPRSKPHP